MKKRFVIALVVSVIFVILISWNFYEMYYYISNEERVCTRAGQSPDEYSFGVYDDPIPPCRKRLDRIDIQKYEDGNCYYATEGGSICSDCGNGNCEEWENPCNCDEDCN